MTYFEIAVLIPCHNEQASVGEVIEQFKKELPSARIIVCDNASTDNTAQVAESAGAEVLYEPKRGKGYAVAKLFRDVEADIFVMVDGDSTYHAPSVRLMITSLVSKNLDLVVGVRVDDGRSNIYPPGHRLGNHFFTRLLFLLYGGSFTDIFSGYRIFSDRYVKSIPLTSRGFDIETEMSIYTLDLGINYSEVQTPYRAREAGSQSKMKTYRDGVLILRKLLMLVSENKPLHFFGFFSLGLFILSAGLFYPLLSHYWETGQVPRFPTLVVVTCLILSSIISWVTGVVLHHLFRSRMENRILGFLQHTSLREHHKKIKF